MTTAAELETARTPTPGTAAGISTGTPGAGTLARGTAAGTVAPLAAGPAAPAPGGTAGTPDAGLLLDLRRLWTRPPTAGTGAGPAETSTGNGAAIGTATRDGLTTGKTSTAPPTARKPTAAELLADRKPRPCLTHTAADLLDEPAPRRPGWIRSTCRRCGGFVGYRPNEPGTRKGDRRR